ncbi:MAG TPA: tyrosine-type recombinase/integrase [Eubacteriales bacterium]|nr:tyrosine-type recombinase/integrase [Eubacteriales bacterium]
MSTNYYKTRDIENIEKLRAVIKELPEFCGQFFTGIESSTTVLTRLNYALDLRLFFHFLAHETRYFSGILPSDFCIRDMDKVTPEHLEQFLSYLNSYTVGGRCRTNGDRGKARKLSTVRAFFKYFFNKNLLTANVAAKVNQPKIREKEIIRLEGEEISGIIENAETGKLLTPRQNAYNRKTAKRDAAILTLLLGTGIRVSELVGLNVPDFDFSNNSFTVTRKGGNRVILYFSEEVAAALISYIEEREKNKNLSPDEKSLFLSLQNQRIGVRAVQNLVKKYGKTAAPLKNISPHKLRSTYGTNLYRATQDIYIVAEVLGHKDVNTTKKHYAAMSEDIRKAAADKVTLREDSEKNDKK